VKFVACLLQLKTNTSGTYAKVKYIKGYWIQNHTLKSTIFVLWLACCSCSRRRWNVWITVDGVHNHGDSCRPLCSRCRRRHSARLLLSTTRESCSRWDKPHKLHTSAPVQV